MFIIRIAGDDVNYQVGSLEIEDSVDERSTATFTVVDKDKSLEYHKGQPVLIYDGNPIFGGVIENAYITTMGTCRFHQIECVDWHYLADKRIVAKAFQDTKPTDIVTEIVDDILSDEGVSYVEATGNEFFLQPSFVVDVDVPASIEDFDEVREVVFNYVPVSQALDALKEQCNAWWRIEPNRNIYFVKKEYLVYPDTLTGDDMLYDSISVEETNPKYRNRQWVRGGKDITDEQIEIKPGDGESHDYAVGYRVARAPIVEVDLGSGYEAESVLIKGLETQRQGECNTSGTAVTRTSGNNFTDYMVGKAIVIAGTRYTIDSVTDNDNLTLTSSAGTQSGVVFILPVWFWEKYSETITQSRDDDVLTSTDRVRVTYYGAIDIIVRTQSDSEITERQTVEEIGTGYVEHVHDQAGIDTRAAALEIGAQKLAKYATMGRLLEFKTLATSLKPGHLVTVNLPDYNLSDVEMLVDSVVISNPDNSDLLISHITAVEGPTHGSWQKFFSELGRAEIDVVRENLGEDEFLVTLQQVTETFNLAETVTPIVNTCSVPATDLYPSTTLYPC